MRRVSSGSRRNQRSPKTTARRRRAPNGALLLLRRVLLLDATAQVQRRAYGGVLFAALLLVVLQLFQSGWITARLDKAHSNLLGWTSELGYQVGDVLVEGRERTSPSRLLESLNVHRGMAILAFDPHAAKKRVEALPWVREASVTRILPDRIRIHLRERRPFALWQYQGKTQVIDHQGEMIPEASVLDFAELPLVVGQDAAAHAAELLAVLDREPEIKSLVSAAIRVRGRRWNLRLANGIDVRLPEGDPSAAWAQLARAEREERILARDISVVDLRMPDRMFVRKSEDVDLIRRNPEEGEDT